MELIANIIAWGMMLVSILAIVLLPLYVLLKKKWMVIFGVLFLILVDIFLPLNDTLYSVVCIVICFLMMVVFRRMEHVRTLAFWKEWLWTFTLISIIGKYIEVALHGALPYLGLTF